MCCSCNHEPPSNATFDPYPDGEDCGDFWPSMSDADTEAMYAAMYADHLRDIARQEGQTARDWTDAQTRQFLRDLASSPAECAYVPVEED
jgi:hypothetical protein